MMFSFQGLCYMIDRSSYGQRSTKQILTDVFGFSRPGMMVALMGSSGAGKSTLLDVLSNRKTTGRWTGAITMNGTPRPATFNRLSGYVEQFDSLNGNSTVRESIAFSAGLRLFPVPSEEQLQHKIDHAITLLSLDAVQDQLVGDEDARVMLPPDVRKKVSIAIELVIDPKVLFLDEPTTGLDAYSALSIMSTVKLLSASIPVICTIHQPSQQVVSLFDAILLLKKGGQVAYFGPVSQSQAYFDSVRAAHADSGVLPREEGENIADYSLNAVDTLSRGPYADQVATWFLQSPWGVRAFENLAAPDGVSSSHGVGAPGEQRVPDAARESASTTLPQQQQLSAGKAGYSRSYSVQLRLLVTRFFLTSLRNRRNWLSRFLTALIFAFVTGTLFAQLGDSQVDAVDRLNLVYFSVRFSLFSGNLKLPGVFSIRVMYLRERQSRMFSPETFLLGRVLADVPFILLEMLLYTLLVYFTVGLTLARNGVYYGLYYLVFILNRMASIGFIEMVGTASASIETAQSVQAAANMVFMLFSGFFIPRQQIPPYWIWLYYLSYFNWPVALLTAEELDHDTVFTCSAESAINITAGYNTCPFTTSMLATHQKCPIQCGNDLLEQYGIQYDTGSLILDFVMVCVFAIVFRVATVVLLRSVNHVQR